MRSIFTLSREELDKYIHFKLCNYFGRVGGVKNKYSLFYSLLSETHIMDSILRMPVVEIGTMEELTERERIVLNENLPVGIGGFINDSNKTIKRALENLRTAINDKEKINSEFVSILVEFIYITSKMNMNDIFEFNLDIYNFFQRNENEERRKFLSERYVQRYFKERSFNRIKTTQLTCSDEMKIIFSVCGPVEEDYKLSDFFLNYDNILFKKD